LINSFKIFNFEIHFYSLFILLGIIIAYFLIIKESKKHNISEDKILNIIFYTILFGILGARLYYVLFNLDYYSNNISEIFMIWNGGLAIHGGIIGGLLFIYFYTKKYKMNFIKIIDISIPGLAIAQAIGRWGNFFNQEAYGSVISLSTMNKLFLPKFIIKGMYIDGNYHIPTFFYESILCLLAFIIILIIRRKNNNLKEGSITAFYCIWYGVVRFIIEIFRTDSLMMGPLKQAQLISIVLIIVGIIIICNKKRKKYKE